MRMTDHDDRRCLRRVIIGTLIPIILAFIIVGLFRAALRDDRCTFRSPEPSYVCATAAFNGESR